MPAGRPKLDDATIVWIPPLPSVSDSGETWKKMVAVVQRAIRLTQPPVMERTKTAKAPTRRDGLWLEDHYALLVAAGY